MFKDINIALREKQAQLNKKLIDFKNCSYDPFVTKNHSSYMSRRAIKWIFQITDSAKEEFRKKIGDNRFIQLSFDRGSCNIVNNIYEMKIVNKR